jgi:hypothetical protein
MIVYARQADQGFLVVQIDNATDLDAELDGILAKQMDKHPHQLLPPVAFY